MLLPNSAVTTRAAFRLLPARHPFWSVSLSSRLERRAAPLAVLLRLAALPFLAAAEAGGASFLLVPIGASVVARLRARLCDPIIDSRSHTVSG